MKNKKSRQVMFLKKEAINFGKEIMPLEIIQETIDSKKEVMSPEATQ